MSGRVLAIDCGNTRIKWGLHEGDAWRVRGAVPVAEIARLGVRWKRLSAPDRIVVANVAGDVVYRRIDRLLARWGVEVVDVKPVRRQCGVINRYTSPDRLGADRWAALIGAWHMVGGPCLVVNAGTATTADMLKRNGVFAGGVILPGLDLMKQSLARDTARLPFAKGRYAKEPRNTSDAIETGCLLAQTAAIERLFSALGAGAVCLLSGGAAVRITPHLRIRARLVDNLVLEGLIRMAR